MIRRNVSFFMLLCFLISTPVSWSFDKITGDACYTYGDNESLIQAEQTAKTLALKYAIESYSIFIESKTNVKNYEVISDIIASISAEQVYNIKYFKRTPSARKICFAVQGYISPEKMKKAIKNYSSDSSSDVQLQDNGYFRIIGEPFYSRACFHGPSIENIEFISESDYENLDEFKKGERGASKADCFLRSLLVHLQFLKPCIANTIPSDEPGGIIVDMAKENYESFLPRFRCNYRFKVFVTFFSEDGKEIETIGEYPRAWLVGENHPITERSPGEKISHSFSLPENAKSWKVWLPK